jgi:hypothetical protein
MAERTRPKASQGGGVTAGHILTAAGLPPLERDGAPRLEWSSGPPSLAPRTIASAPRVRRLITPNGLRLPATVVAWLRATAAPASSVLELLLVEALVFIQVHGAALTPGAPFDQGAAHED